MKKKLPCAVLLELMLIRHVSQVAKSGKATHPYHGKAIVILVH